jgi:hypothetical protein
MKETRACGLTPDRFRGSGVRGDAWALVGSDGLESIVCLVSSVSFFLSLFLSLESIT